MAASTVTDDDVYAALSHADTKLTKHDSSSIDKNSLVSSKEKAEEYGNDVSEEDQLHLRRVADKIPWRTYLIAYVELAERFSFYVSSVLRSPTPISILLFLLPPLVPLCMSLSISIECRLSKWIEWHFCYLKY